MLPVRPFLSFAATLLHDAECGAHLRGGRQAEGLMAAVAGEAAWFGGAKRVAEPGCERSERRILADVCSMSARTSNSTVSG
jgi:hypothetical protein